MAERRGILYMFSKKFAMTVWRLGAAIAPREIAEVIAEAAAMRKLLVLGGAPATSPHAAGSSLSLM